MNAMMPRGKQAWHSRPHGRADVKPELPSSLTLPSGAVVELRRAPSEEDPPCARSAGEPLFAEVESAVRARRVAILKDGAPVDVGALPLRDFHVIRAVLTRSGILEEAEVEVSCENCGEPIRTFPCAALEIAPWADGEARDPVLDVTLPLGEAIEVPLIPLGRVRSARTVTFEERTVAQARPLFAAAAKEPPLDMTAAVVRAMGIVALGAERDASKIAAALRQCDDDALAAVEDAFLATHYVPRLGCVVFCGKCGARNDVDAPCERECEGAEVESDGERESGSGSEREGEFPAFEVFAARAREIAAPLMEVAPTADVELIIEGGTPAVDDGGEMLLGSYSPPDPGGAGHPTCAPVVTVYYRTFRAMWNEDERFDWDDELVETIEHELEHHVAFLGGNDPTDDEERAVIRDEAVRLGGRREAERRAIKGFGASVRDFARRTWPLWVLALLGLLARLFLEGE
jgi:hypothetical protein